MKIIIYLKLFLKINEKCAAKLILKLQNYIYKLHKSLLQHEYDKFDPTIIEDKRTSGERHRSVQNLDVDVLSPKPIVSR
jgi:hypothetical protein